MYKVFSGDETLEIKESEWAQFCAAYTIIEAAGGIVQNEDKETLMIYRRGKWDLPKGKHDDGESIEECALREVKEECGLSTLAITKKVGVTYHTYTDQWHGKVLKPTHWYAMQGSKYDVLKAQYEEDITACEWVSKDLLEGKIKNTFPLIKEILNNYL